LLAHFIGTANMRSKMTIGEGIEHLALSLFGHVPSQTAEDDQRSLPAVQTFEASSSKT
jgi:hypothetical protein